MCDMKRLLLVVGLGLVVLAGCKEGEDDQESLAKRTGAKVGETLTEFATGVGSGIDTKLAVPVELTEELAGKGMSKTVAKTLTAMDKGKGFSVYLIAEKALSATLMAKAFNAEGLEIGRCKVEVKFEADDAEYVAFKFDDQMDMALVAKYVVDVVDVVGEGGAVAAPKSADVGAGDVGAGGS